MRQSISIHQQIDHKIRIEGSRRSNVLKPGCTKSAGEPILDAHFHGANALRLDFDLKGRDPTARSEGPVLASGKSLAQA